MNILYMDALKRTSFTLHLLVILGHQVCIADPKVLAVLFRRLQKPRNVLEFVNKSIKRVLSEKENAG